MANSFNSLRRISELYELEKDSYDSKLELSGDIKVSKLSFAYHPYCKVLDNFSLKIERGKKVMIAGPSGSGKSTLAKLLMGYYDSSPKQIYLDDKDITTYLKGSVKRQISYVSQQELIFTDSLYNNIVLGRKISDELYTEACYIANIDRLADKYDKYMLIDENGNNLSGGEREQIMIARALLARGNILILDESLGEMDVSLERNILQRMFAFYKEKTIIVISHRLDNADLYDKVVNL